MFGPREQIQHGQCGVGQSQHLVGLVPWGQGILWGLKAASELGSQQPEKVLPGSSLLGPSWGKQFSLGDHARRHSILDKEGTLSSLGGGVPILSLEGELHPFLLTAQIQSLPPQNWE